MSGDRHTQSDCLRVRQVRKTIEQYYPHIIATFVLIAVAAYFSIFCVLWDKASTAALHAARDLRKIRKEYIAHDHSGDGGNVAVAVNETYDYNFGGDY